MVVIVNACFLRNRPEQSAGTIELIDAHNSWCIQLLLFPIRDFQIFLGTIAV